MESGEGYVGGGCLYCRRLRKMIAGVITLNSISPFTNSQIMGLLFVVLVRVEALSLSETVQEDERER